MLNKLNHIGIAVPNMERSKEKHVKKGFKIIKESYNESFLTQLCLMENEKEVIELVYTNNPNSIAFNLCSKNEETIYHKCYEVENIELELKNLKDNNYIVISDIVYSELLLGQVCFLYNKEKGIIELLEKNKK